MTNTIKNNVLDSKLYNPELAIPSASHLFLFTLLLGWLWLAPILVGILSTFFPEINPIVSNGISVILLAVLLLAPAVGYTALAWRRAESNLRPLALMLLVISLYIVFAAAIRIVAEPGSGLETVLRLTALTMAALLLGGLGLLGAGVPKPMLSHAIGFDPPPLAGIFVTLACIAVITLGWPLTGALGDNWASQLIVLQILALVLPEEILFRGAVLGIITFNFQHRKVFSALLAFLGYLAFTSSPIVPRQEWLSLFSFLMLAPLALIVIELRALTGSIWSGILFAVAYRAAPLLFTDPRAELPLITQPWQTFSYIWMIYGGMGLAFVVWAMRKVLTPRWTFSRFSTATMALVLAVAVWMGWLGAWFTVGYPGFHSDGFLIIMHDQADLSEVAAISDLTARRQFVRDRLIETAIQTQQPVREALDAAGLRYRPFYVINMIQVEGHHRRLDDFADLPGVDRVMLNPNVRPYPFSFNPGYGDSSDEGEGIGWNIRQVEANEAWGEGATGQDVVIAGQDTGYDWRHPALIKAYRGNNRTGINHNYNWFDAWYESAVPFDDDTHGTHTMGTMLGDDGQSNQIGMAPDAQWIGCRNMRRGIGNPASYSACMEFFLAPYPIGADPFVDGDVSFAPDVINNSWGCPDIEGCDDDVLEPAADALRAAGIMMVVSAGNSGPGCQTVSEPPARYDSVFSVGATNQGSSISSFSSRGPVPGDESLLKPDISAPGSNIRSSLAGGGYGTADGTSMAGPHVAGLVALIWSANPDLIGQIDATEDIIRQSAEPAEVVTACQLDPANSTDEPSVLEELENMVDSNTCACGDVTGVPNNVYGWGEINALKAVQLAQMWGNEQE
ncbi:MAG: S8 family serine peptidase [Anaerolineae bacterium]|nr:S8 family serine peptidase [Anaerolineae bacterium]